MENKKIENPFENELKISISKHLTEEEAKNYGAFNRNPQGYQKIDVLGKGGYAVVWRCIQNSTNL